MLRLADPPIDLEELDLSTIMLVDSFPIREQHAGSVPKVRVINNFKSNGVNDYAWTPSGLRYNGFTELLLQCYRRIGWGNC